jgi:hypothetical protein
MTDSSSPPSSSITSFVYDSAAAAAGSAPKLPTNATQVTISSSLKQIPARAFRHKFIQELKELTIQEGIEVIGENAFSMGWSLGNIRLPSSMKTIEKDAFAHCVLKLRSVELPPHRQIAIGDTAFQGCALLRNIAIHIKKNNESDGGRRLLGKGIFKGCHNLSKVFPDPEDLLEALVHRFDGLPIHQICYYHSYDDSTETALQKLQAAFHESQQQQRHQDCLGMTPLHILALSKTQRIELYQACLEQHPEDIVTQDKWAALPIYYACESNAPLEIIQFLLKMQQSLFPEQTVHWNDFLLRFGPDFFCTAPLEVVQLLVDYQQKHCPEELEWNRLIHDVNCFGPIDVFRYIVNASLADRIQALEWEPWRVEMATELQDIPQECLQTAPWVQTHENNDTLTGIDHVDKIQSKLAKYECMNKTFLLELAFWKLKMTIGGKVASPEQEQGQTEEFRNNCHINSGVEHIIPNVLSFLRQT